MMIDDEALELLSSLEGRKRVIAMALTRAAMPDVSRNEIDAAKEMRQCALAMVELAEREELEALAVRMERAAAALEGGAETQGPGSEEALSSGHELGGLA